MTKKIVFGAAIALMIVGLVAPSVSASCSPDKTASTYNPGTGNFAYWKALPTATGLYAKIWDLTANADITGVCNQADGGPGILYFGATAGDIGMNISMGNGCATGCPGNGNTMAVAATVTGPDGTQFLSTKVVENPSSAVVFDWSTLGDKPLSPPLRLHVTSSSRVGNNVNLGVSVESVAGFAYDGTAAQVTGFNIVSGQAATDPGPLANAPYGLRLFIPAAGGVAGVGSTSVDCTNTTLPQWVAAQVMTSNGAVKSVSSRIQVNCNPILANPKYKVVPKKGMGTGTVLQN